MADKTREVPKKDLEDAVRLALLREQDEDQDDARDSQIREQLKKIESALSDDKYFRSEFSVNSLNQEVKGVMMVLRECIIAHRWKAALQLLSILVNYLPDTRSAVFKIGLEVFFFDRGDHAQLLDQFLGQLKVAEGCWNRKEIVVEFALFLMSQGEYQRAREQLKNVGAVRRFKKASTEYTQHWERLHKIYQGLGYYMDWWLCTREIKELQETLLAGDEQEEIVDRVRVKEYDQQKHADLALDCLQDLHKAPGVWDTFILKQVELLEFQGKTQAAHDVLKIYQDSNISNPNAVRYLYEFYDRHDGYEELCVDTLRNFCDMVPSDSLCLELHSRCLKKGETPSSLLYLLFDLLDHFQWQDNPEAWKILSQQLQLALQSKEEKPIQECWQNRKTWWPAYHFRTDQTIALTPQQRDCLLYKGCIATSLLGHDNEFTKTLNDQGLLDSEDIANFLILPNNRS